MLSRFIKFFARNIGKHVDNLISFVLEKSAVDAVEKWLKRREIYVILISNVMD